MSTDSKIHPTAVIDPAAQLGKNVTVGPYCVISGPVTIGDHCQLHSHVIINGNTQIGEHNEFFSFSVIGQDPQDKKYEGEETILSIGDRNVFREAVTVNRGTSAGGGVTRIGSDNLLMAYVHVAHDCVIGNHVTFANNASLAGHVEVKDYVNLGGFVGVFQFCTIGEYAFLGGGSMVIKDVPPFVAVSGYPARAVGLNLIGLQRAGFSETTLALLKKAYKILYRSGLKTEDAIAQITALDSNLPSALESFLLFLKKRNTRGFVR